MRADTRAWFSRRTSTAGDWPVEVLADRKGSTTVAVVLPALNEEETVGTIVQRIVSLADRSRLVDDIVVVDSGSTDRTAERAAASGARVVHRDDIVPDLPSRPGKGEVLWRSLHATTADIVVYVDADLTDFRPHYVTGLLGPILSDPSVQLVKAFYDRPLAGVSPVGGGRVTELTARPLLNAFLPELAGVVQPLAGEYAGRRSLLERLPFAPGYGVETGILIDTVLAHGIDAVAQVDLGERGHGHQDTAALGRMSATIIQTLTARIGPARPEGHDLVQFSRVEGEVVPVTWDIPWEERPPMISLPSYQASRRASSATA
ncbi:glucosyl-3-phosphoglycerate synthase [Cryptosporangium aurantiacum]|uniref:Glucosyl-3-phosphoglycerate synthase n=1 Tax=Cryptosporangium aurantiacum TaxID=134849 RepID=A0A1M7IIH2_9ACTN|nr:glucosyl-3-phosphoglycerate synthase [Cryptosporangium aurantiacum]SHM40602.1 glucosyl-3-phosphoglycerate synthase [Cryptosporangium aurantiacum]